MRLDVALTSRGISRSRNQAARLIQQGSVTVNGQTQTKPSHVVLESDAIEANQVMAVSRAGGKLSFALEEFGITPSGVCLDVGASTGGFTEVLLGAGAEKVIAIDVGHDQLSPELQLDPRVVNVEGTNVRELTLSQLRKIVPEKPSLVVVDLSFISLTVVAKKLLELAQGAELVILIKPQFELSKEKLRAGVVKVDSDREAAKENVLSTFSELGAEVAGVCVSPVVGTKGNTEFLAHLR
ncbi:TlyA family RNA methyltransferase [Aquiluna sp.]|nr:TlyA family RNA methyltransferase [Aquiluna sp.]